MRITVAVPEQLTANANQLAMALGLSAADANTYTELKYADADDNLYSVASFIASASTVSKAQDTLTRPLWDEEETIDMSQAEQAKSLVAFDTAASIDTISAIVNDAALTAIELMKLTRYEEVQVEPESESKPESKPESKSAIGE